MSSQNESILCLAKADCLGCIMKKTKINLGTIIALENHIRAKKSWTSLPFLLLIIVLCKRVGVPRDAKKDVEATPKFSTDITRIKIEYLKDKVERKKEETPVAINPIPPEASLTTPTTMPLGTSSATTPLANNPSSSIVVVVSRDQIIQASLVRMGQLASLPIVGWLVLKPPFLA